MPRISNAKWSDPSTKSVSDQTGVLMWVPIGKICRVSVLQMYFVISASMQPTLCQIENFIKAIMWLLLQQVEMTYVFVQFSREDFGCYLEVPQQFDMAKGDNSQIRVDWNKGAKVGHVLARLSWTSWFDIQANAFWQLLFTSSMVIANKYMSSIVWDKVDKHCRQITVLGLGLIRSMWVLSGGHSAHLWSSL